MTKCLHQTCGRCWIFNKECTADEHNKHCSRYVKVTVIKLTVKESDVISTD